MQRPLSFQGQGQAKPWTSLPRFNRAHPMAGKFATYIYDHNGVLVDLINNTVGTIVSPGGVGGSKVGFGQRFALTTYAFMPPFPVGKIAPFGGAAPYWAAMGTLFNSLVGPASPDSNCISVQGADNSQDTIFGFNSWPPGDPTTPNRISCVFGNTTNSWFTPVINPGHFQSWAMVATSSSSATLYADGLLDITFSGTTIFTTNTQGQIMVNTASINAGQTFGNGVSGQLPYFAMGSGILTALDARELHFRPWAPYGIPLLIYPEDEILSRRYRGVVAAAVVLAEPHFIGRMRQQPLVSLPALRQNQPSDTSGPLGVQADPNTHFVGRFKPPTMTMLQGLRHNAALDVPIVAIIDNPPGFVGKFIPPSVKLLRSLRENQPSDISGPLPLQPETNTHFVGKFQPPKMAALQAYRQNPALDNPAVVITDNPPAFVGRFVPPFMRVLQSLRQNPASDASSSVTQPETNTHFVGRFAPPINWLLRSLRENHASDASSLSLQPETNTHFIGKFAPTAINLLPALRQNTANDFSTATTQPDPNTHFIGRFAQLPMTLPLTSRQNQANDFFVAAPFDNPTHFIGKFTPPVVSGLRSMRENTANDTSTPAPQPDTETHFIARFVQTPMMLLQSSRQNQATDISTAVAQIFDWLVTARRRGRR